MTRHVALLRGVNVGGNNPVAMAELRAMFETLGLENPRTLLQSGNVVFDSPRKADALKALLEAETQKRFGFATRYLLRTAAEWQAMIAANPFPDVAKRDPGRFVLFLLADKASASALKTLAQSIVGNEKIHGAGTHLYATFPDGQARSKLTANLIDAKLETVCTGRNWNTVLKLGALLNEGTT